MIKLKKLIKEEKEAFRLEREGKIQIDVEKQVFGYSIRIYSNNKVDLDDKTYWKGYMNLARELPDEMVGSPMWKHGYLFVDHIKVNLKHQGYGYLLYKNALKLSQDTGYKGLCSYIKGRSEDASDIWNKLKTSSDNHYDYLDIKDLGIKIKEQFLSETPVDTYDTIGNFDKGASFRDKRDRELITHPTAIHKVKDFFKNTSTNFDFYFVNLPGRRKFAEKGKVKSDFIFDEYPRGLGINHSDLKNGINSDNITVFFVGNSAAEKLPMTSWTIAHRFGHVLRREYAFEQLDKWLDSQFDELLQLFNISSPKNGYGDDFYKYQNIFNKSKCKLFNQIGTMKSARDGKINRYFEFYYELFAQYLKNGNIQFNKLSNSFVKSHGAYGRRELAYTQDTEAANNILLRIVNNFKYYAEDVLSDSIGNIYVM